MAANDAGAGGATPRLIKVLLFVSLALNLLVLGLVAGFAYKMGGDRGHPRTAFQGGGAAPFMQALTPEERHALARSIADLREDPRGHRERTRARFAGVLGALRAQPFDAAALAAILDAQEEAADRRRRSGQLAFVTLIEAQEPAARAAFADRLEQVLKAPRQKAEQKRLKN